MKNIMIIGANGFTGRQILNDLSSKAQYKVTGCSLHPDILPKNGGNYHFITTDIRDEAVVKQLFKDVQPDVVINCSALSVPDYCETHHEEAWLTNVTAVEQLAHLCESYKSRFIHLSTDFVFDGKIDEKSGQLYTEKSLPAPVNYYGFTKWKGEEKVTEICSNYAIARVEIVYGKALPGQHGNIVQLVMNRLNAGQEIRVVSDQWRTPTYVGDVSAGVQHLVENAANGIFHICGEECLTIAEIAFQVADYMKLDCSLVHPATTEEMQEINAEYDKLFAILKNAKSTADGKVYETSEKVKETPEEFKKIINELVKLQGIEIEICGDWIWITGNTYSCREQLKALKFRFSKKKTAWYFHEADYKKKSKKTYSLDEIRELFGSDKIIQKQSLLA